MLAVVAEGAYLGIDHLVALVLGDVVLVVGDEGHEAVSYTHLDVYKRQASRFPRN